MVSPSQDSYGLIFIGTSRQRASPVKPYRSQPSNQQGKQPRVNQSSSQSQIVTQHICHPVILRDVGDSRTVVTASRNFPCQRRVTKAHARTNTRRGKLQNVTTCVLISTCVRSDDTSVTWTTPRRPILTHKHIHGRHGM